MIFGNWSYKILLLFVVAEVGFFLQGLPPGDTALEDDVVRSIRQVIFLCVPPSSPVFGPSSFISASSNPL